MSRIVKGSVLGAVGLMAAFGIFSLTQYAMVLSSSSRFCATCHEIRFACETWKTSTHVNNGEGLVAECMDCHLPPLTDTASFYYMKVYHGVRDLVGHFTQKVYDHEKNRKAVYETTKNAFCQKCHNNLLYIPDKRGAMLAHRSVIYARPGYEKRCLDCHQNLVHKPSAIYDYEQYQSS